MRLQFSKATSWSVAMNEKPKPEASLSNDVQLIRNILLGEHLEKFQKQMDALEKEISELKKENKVLRKELEAEVEKRSQELIAQLEQTKVEQTNAGKALSKEFDSQIKQIEKRLSAYEDGQGNLISSLANALLEHQNKSGK